MAAKTKIPPSQCSLMSRRPLAVFAGVAEAVPWWLDVGSAAAGVIVLAESVLRRYLEKRILGSDVCPYGIRLRAISRVSGFTWGDTQQ
eukprot:scaffold20181_cov62-Cyclotella_meneghiniana.AAC.2